MAIICPHWKLQHHRNFPRRICESLRRLQACYNCIYQSLNVFCAKHFTFNTSAHLSFTVPLQCVIVPIFPDEAQRSQVTCPKSHNLQMCARDGSVTMHLYSFPSQFSLQCFKKEKQSPTQSPCRLGREMGSDYAVWERFLNSWRKKKKIL